MANRPVLSIVTILILAALATPMPLFGQTVAVSGVVRDPSGGSIPGAVVTLRRDGTARTSTTDIQGSFSFDSVSAGTYDLVVERESFKTTSTQVIVDNRIRGPLVFRLEIADNKQEVTVAEDAVQVSAQPGNNQNAAVLDRNLLDNLPIFDQNYISTISRFLDAGVAGTGGVTLIVDGLQVSSVSLPSSAIQEVKINQNPYSPEFLRPGRGRIEIITKASSPVYHGTFNSVLRDNRFNSREAFAVQKPQEQRRIFEYSFTGPLGSGKTSSFMLTGTYQSESAKALVVADTPSGAVRDNVPQPQREVDLSARLSHQFGNRNTASLVFESLDQYRKNQGVGGFNLPEVASNYRNREDTFTLTDVSTFSSRLVNEFRILLGKEYQPTRSVTVAPRIVVLDAFTAGGAQADRLQTEYHTAFHDAATYVQGRHTLRMGIDVPDISRRGLEDQTNFLGTFTFSDVQSYLLSRPFSFVQQTGQDKVIFWEKVLAGFILDDIRVRPNLTVSLAARYDWQNYFHDRSNISPRIAFAYSPNRYRSTVIRGGAGVFYDRTGAQPIFDLLRYDGQRLRQFVITDPGFPNPWPGGIQPLAAPSSIVKLDPQVRIPYLLQFGIGVERQIWKSTALTINYTGNEGVGNFRSRDVNAPPPPLFAGRPDPSLGVVRQIESSGRLESHSMDVTFRGNMTRYFSGMMQYTLSRTYNNTNGIASFPANNYDLSGEWGRADTDQRHRLNVIGTVKAGKLFTLGVSLAMNSGRPYTLTTGMDDFHTGTANARPADVGRNTLQGPGFSQFDLRWSRDFKRAKGKRDVSPTTTVAIDSFNVLNHVNYSAYIGNLSSPFFGKAISAQAPRRLQLTARFSF